MKVRAGLVAVNGLRPKGAVDSTAKCNGSSKLDFDVFAKL